MYFQKENGQILNERRVHYDIINKIIIIINAYLYNACRDACWGKSCQGTEINVLLEKIK